MDVHTHLQPGSTEEAAVGTDTPKIIVTIQHLNKCEIWSQSGPNRYISVPILLGDIDLLHIDRNQPICSPMRANYTTVLKAK